MNIGIGTIPHNAQCYPTIGDWRIYGENLYIMVSELGDWKMEALVALHEMVEALLCTAAGISGGKVTAFDKAFEERRSRGEVPADAEPGDDPAAPYHAQHIHATFLERSMATALGVDWDEYDRKVKAL